MTGYQFREWAQGINERLKKEKRTIALILDNCPAHPKDLELSNVNVIYLPLNTMSKLQPVDQGVIQNLTCLYCKQLSHCILNDLDDGSEQSKPITVLDALIYISAAWEKVTPSTITTCFKHCGFQHACPRYHGTF